MRNRTIAALLVVAILAGAGAGYFVGLSSTHATTSTTTTQNNYGNQAECGYATYCVVQEHHGIVLALTINASVIRSNGSITFGISEYNPTPNQVNLSLSDNWVLDGLTSIYACYGGNPPYGVTIYRGYYTLQNISMAHYLSFSYMTAAVSCLTPALRPVTGFWAPPFSGIRVEYGNAKGSFAIMPYPFTVYAIDGTFVNMSNPSVNNGEPGPVDVYSLRSSQPAVYTLAAGDEWGTLVLLHFSVV